MSENEEIAELNHQPGTIPIGGVIPYFGRLENLHHKKWQLCDGSKIQTGPLKGGSTPQLQDRFLRGTSDAQSVGQEAGEDFHEHGEAPPIGGMFEGSGRGQTHRSTGRKHSFAEDDVHPQNEGPNCHTYEWDVSVNVSGNIKTHAHSHPKGKNVPKHLKALYIIRIG